MNDFKHTSTEILTALLEDMLDELCKREQEDSLTKAQALSIAYLLDEGLCFPTVYEIED